MLVAFPPRPLSFPSSVLHGLFLSSSKIINGDTRAPGLGPPKYVIILAFLWPATQQSFTAHWNTWTLWCVFPAIMSGLFLVSRHFQEEVRTGKKLAPYFFSIFLFFSKNLRTNTLSQYHLNNFFEYLCRPNFYSSLILLKTQMCGEIPIGKFWKRVQFYNAVTSAVPL